MKKKCFNFISIFLNPKQLRFFRSSWQLCVYVTLDGGGSFVRWTLVDRCGIIPACCCRCCGDVLSHSCCVGDRDCDPICRSEHTIIAEQNMREMSKVRVCFYIAQYSVRWTAQSALHFFPSLADQFIPTPTRKHSSHAAIARNDYALTFPPYSQVLIYSAEWTVRNIKKQELL